jgi:predicted HTH transcriptional regulator
MFLGKKKLGDISETDIMALRENDVREGKSIDYKVFLPEGSPSDMKEFLVDVASYANTSGGHIVFGIDENEGIPAK